MGGDWVWLGTSCSPNICLPTPPLIDPHEKLEICEKKKSVLPEIRKLNAKFY